MNNEIKLLFHLCESTLVIIPFEIYYCDLVSLDVYF